MFQMLDLLPIFLVLGIFAGLMAGLLGLGGGLIIVPALIFIFARQGFDSNYLTQMAVASSLASVIFTSLSAIRTHNKGGMIQWPIFRWLSVGIVFGAVAGAYLATGLKGEYLQALFGIFAISIAAQMIFGRRPKPGRGVPKAVVLNAAGIFIGLISAVFGIGGGSLTVPLLTWFNIDMKKVVATSAACTLPIAIFGVLGFISSGWHLTDLPDGSTAYVYWPAVIGISLTSIVSAHFGAKLAHRLPSDLLKKLFAAFLFMMGLRFILNAL